MVGQTDWLRPLHGLSELASGILPNGLGIYEAMVFNVPKVSITGTDD